MLSVRLKVWPQMQMPRPCRSTSDDFSRCIYLCPTPLLQKLGIRFLSHRGLRISRPSICVCADFDADADREAQIISRDFWLITTFEPVMKLRPANLRLFAADLNPSDRWRGLHTRAGIGRTKLVDNLKSGRLHLRLQQTLRRTNVNAVACLETKQTAVELASSE